MVCGEERAHEGPRSWPAAGCHLNADSPVSETTLRWLMRGGLVNSPRHGPGGAVVTTGPCWCHVVVRHCPCHHLCASVAYALCPYLVGHSSTITCLTPLGPVSEEPCVEISSRQQHGDDAERNPDCS